MKCRKCETEVSAWRYAFEVYWRLTVLGFCNCGETCYDNHESWDMVNLHDNEAAAAHRYGKQFVIEHKGTRHGGGVQLRLPFAK